MSKFFGILAVTLVSGVALAVAPANAQQDLSCTSSVSLGTFNNVTVPKGASCSLAGVTILGDVRVGSGADLFVGAATINGNRVEAIINGYVLATNALLLVISSGTTVVRNVSFIGTTAELTIQGSNVGGNILVVGAGPGAGIVDVDHNVVTGNISLLDNRSNVTVTVAGNSIGMNLVCVNNTPPPTNRGARNIVSGHEVGQCEGL